MELANRELLSKHWQRNIGDPYLKLKLTQEIIAALPMSHAEGVVVTSYSSLTVMPNMPNCVLGLFNRRSRVFWVVDLPQLLDLGAIAPDQQQLAIVIIRVDNIPLGLAVQEVQEVIRLNLEEIQSPVGTVGPGLVPYLKGCVLQEQPNRAEVLMILDSQAIVNSPVFTNN
jgi:positive phototaxis protein PixI